MEPATINRGLVMVTNTLLRTLKTVRPRIPLIKFRKGGSQSGTDASAKSSGSQSSGSKPTLGPYIEDTDLPPKYARQPPTAAEIEYINRGGPE